MENRDEDLGPLSHLGEELGPRVLGDVVGHLEVAVGAGPLGVHDPLGDPLAVEVGELLEQVHVLDEHRPLGPGGHRVQVVVDRHPESGGAVFLLFLP